GHQSAGIIPKPAKIEMKPIWIEGPQRRGAEPHIVIDTGGRRAIGGFADARDPIQVSPAAHDANLSELAGFDELDGILLVFAAAPLRTHLDDALILAGSFQHRATFDDGAREWLF